MIERSSRINGRGIQNTSIIIYFFFCSFRVVHFQNYQIMKFLFHHGYTVQLSPWRIFGINLLESILDLGPRNPEPFSNYKVWDKWFACIRGKYHHNLGATLTELHHDRSDSGPPAIFVRGTSVAPSGVRLLRWPFDIMLCHQCLPGQNYVIVSTRPGDKLPYMEGRTNFTITQPASLWFRNAWDTLGGDSETCGPADRFSGSHEMTPAHGNRKDLPTNRAKVFMDCLEIVYVIKTHHRAMFNYRFTLSSST